MLRTLIRRRVKIMLVVVFLAAMVFGIWGVVATGVGGWLSRGQTATGLLVVSASSDVPEPGKTTPLLDGDQIDRLKETYAVMFMHPSLFQEAASRADGRIIKTKWYASFEQSADPAADRLADLKRNLVVVSVPKSRLLSVSMTTVDREDAKAIVEELSDLLLANQAQEYANAERKKIDLLTKEVKLFQTELEQDVDSDLARLEKAGYWDSGREHDEIRQQLNRILNEQTRMAMTAAEVGARLGELDRCMREGSIPPEVEAQIQKHPRYLSAVIEKDRAERDARTEKLVRTMATPAPTPFVLPTTGPATEPTTQPATAPVVPPTSRPSDDLPAAAPTRQEMLVQARASSAAKQLDEIHDTLQAELTTSVRSSYISQLQAAKANQVVIDNTIKELGERLSSDSQLNDKAADLKKKQARLMSKISEYEQEIRRIREFRLHSGWTPIRWSSRPEK